MEHSITFGSIPNMELSFRMEDVTLDGIPETPSPAPRVVPQQQQQQQQQQQRRVVTPRQSLPQQFHGQQAQVQAAQPSTFSQEMAPSNMTKSFSFQVPEVFRVEKPSLLHWLNDVPVPEEDDEQQQQHRASAASTQQPHGEKHALDEDMPDYPSEQGGRKSKRARLSISSEVMPPGFAKRRNKIARTSHGFVRRVSDVYQRVVSSSQASERSASRTNLFSIPTTPTTPTTAVTAVTPTTPSSSFGRPKISFVFVGDSGCGKSSLLLRYCHNMFDEAYTPTQYEMYNKSVVVNKREVDVEMWDTSGSIKLHQLQRLSYMRWSAVFLCFDLTDQKSFDHAQNKWVNEIRIHCPGTPIILLGLNKDKRSISPGLLLDPFQPRGTRISAGEASMAATGMGAAKYMECSAKTGEGVQRVFDESIRIVLDEHSDDGAARAKGKSQVRRLGQAFCFG